MVVQSVGRVHAPGEQAARVVADEPAERVQPPVPPVVVEANVGLVPVAADGGERRERDARVDLAVVLHPAGDVAVPAAHVVPVRLVVVGRVEGEQVWSGDLVGVVDPSGLDGLALGRGAGVGGVVADDGDLQQGKVRGALHKGLEDAVGGGAAVVAGVLRRARVPVRALVGARGHGCRCRGGVVAGAREPFHRPGGAVGAEDRHRSGGPGVRGLDGSHYGRVLPGGCALEEGRRRRLGDVALRRDGHPVEGLAAGRGCGFDDGQVVAWRCWGERSRGGQADQGQGREDGGFHGATGDERNNIYMPLQVYTRSLRIDDAKIEH